MARLRLTLAYDGTAFAGWQIQAAGGGRTVQGCLEDALATLCGQAVRVHGAGRTDSGVHALAQVAHVDVPEHRAGLPWGKALTALLPKDVAVTEARLAAPDFHSRFDATGKEYRYTLWTRSGWVLPWRRPYVWDVGRHGALNVAAMEACAGLFVGEHDFAAFQNAGTDVHSTVRRVWDVSRLEGTGPDETVWRFHGEGFLKQMVRNLMGALVTVGRGKATPEDVAALLAAGDRRRAPGTAPAQGLCLHAVEYGPLAVEAGLGENPGGG